MISGASRSCPVCGAGFLGWAERCSVCGVALVDAGRTSPVREGDVLPFDVPEDLQVVYELAEWPAALRQELEGVLRDAGVVHAWEGTDLIVHEDDEAQLDQLTEAIEDRWRAELGLEAGAAFPAALGFVGGAPAGAELEYDLSEWSDAQRAALSEALDAAGLGYGWEDTRLVVAAEDEEEVEAVLDAVEFPDALDAEPDDEGDAGFEAMSELFLAADRLMNDPADADAAADLAEAVAGAQAGHPPYGIARAVWEQLVGEASRLHAAVASGETADDELIDQASALRAKLRELV